VIHQALNLRQGHRDWFGPEAAYTPLEPAGEDADRVVAYQRGENVITIVPRWMQTSGLPNATLTIPPGRWTNVLTHEEVQPGKQNTQALLHTFPVALLVTH
jgi:(1->4)-alpha-D-glucan 1-alpha-D-glucosylmutase